MLLGYPLFLTGKHEIMKYMKEAGEVFGQINMIGIRHIFGLFSCLHDFMFSCQKIPCLNPVNLVNPV